MSFPKPFYRWRPHPWHGLSPGDEAPGIVQAYIEITPFDTVKYEIDKITGYLRIDRPQATSSRPPMLYGFIPRTFCAQRVAALNPEGKRGDGDPLDICVICERPVSHADIVLDAKVIGGLPMIDNDEADDKIIAVLKNDSAHAHIDDVSELPPVYVERLMHYFNTYKMAVGQLPSLAVKEVYDRKHAFKVIEASLADYKDEYGE
ncbi:MAG: inorganic pyrophosphatase [Gammaproteobacteria bacterium]|jgi:inorganic pyrophosphatase